MQNLRKLKKRKKNQVMTHEQSAIENLCEISKLDEHEKKPIEVDLFVQGLDARASPREEKQPRQNRSKQRHRISISPNPHIRIETTPAELESYCSVRQV